MPSCLPTALMASLSASDSRAMGIWPLTPSSATRSWVGSGFRKESSNGQTLVLNEGFVSSKSLPMSTRATSKSYGGLASFDAKPPSVLPLPQSVVAKNVEKIFSNLVTASILAETLRTCHNKTRTRRSVVYWSASILGAVKGPCLM
jgi:hypothetical protein